MYGLLIEPLAPWKFWIDLLAAGCAFGAALLWLRASVVEVTLPEQGFELPPTGMQPHDLSGLVASIGVQSRLNARAAMFAAASACITGVSVMIGTHWD
jgi:hypothetical protein